MGGKPRVLIIAEAANPEWVSVPLIGWSLARALAEVADTHIVTQIRNRDAILRAGLTEGRDFTVIDSEALAAPLWRLAERLRMGKGVGWTMTQLISSFGYGYFERLVWRRFGSAILNGDYDIVHRVTPLSPVVNSPLAANCAAAGVPFILGPINGGVPWPPGFRDEQRREKEWLSTLRGLYRLRPARRRMLDAASAILCGSVRARSEIPARYQDKTVWLPENAVDPDRFFLKTTQNGELPLRACFIGRLVPLKGVDMAIQAMAPYLRDGRMRFDIVGDGPQMEALKAQVSEGGLADSVIFHGWQSHHDVQTIAAQCHVMVLPSIREFGGGVVLEAMALSVVPIVADYAGPAELVDDSLGFRVSIRSRADLIAGLADVFARLINEPAQLAAMSAAARERIRTSFTWSAKAGQLRRIYDAVLAGEPLPQVLPPPDRPGG